MEQSVFMTRKQTASRRQEDVRHVPKAGANKKRLAGGQERGGVVQKEAWAGVVGTGGEGTSSSQGPWGLREMGVN